MSESPFSYPKNAAPLWRDPLRWNRTNRAFAMGLLILGARVTAAGFASSMASPGEPVRLVRPDLLAPVEVAMWLLAATWAVICGAGLWLSRSHRDAPAYVTTVLVAFWLTNGLFIYGNGITSPPGWVLMVAMVLLVNLLFDEKHAYGGMALSFAIVITTGIAERFGWLPYAPLMSAEGLMSAGRPSDRLLIATVVPTMMAATPMLLTGHVALQRLRERERQLEWLSRVDPLTQLANRRAFLERFQAELARSARSGQAVAVAILDVDHFKHVNDMYGHAVGDRALEQIAQALRSAVRTSDLVARIGGEEMAVLMPDTELPGALVVAERCRAKVAAIALIAKGNVVSLTATFGVTASQPSEAVPDLDALLAAADHGLYVGKQAGRNRVEVGRVGAQGGRAGAPSGSFQPPPST